MNHKEIAERLRELDDNGNWGGVQALANELDPQPPEPGTVVRWRYQSWPSGKWLTGIVREMQDSIIAEDGFRELLENIEWKPARILADDEVPVKVPPVSGWPGDANGLSLDVKWGNEYGLWDSNPIRRVFKITRAEAEKMEAEG